MNIMMCIQRSRQTTLRKSSPCCTAVVSGLFLLASLGTGNMTEQNEANTTTNTNTTATTVTTTTNTTTTVTTDTIAGTTRNKNNAPLELDTFPVEDAQKGKTDIIVYVAIGLSGLLIMSFCYVCLRKIRKKGCPPWCPAPCHDLECGKPNEDDENHPHQTTVTVTANGQSPGCSVFGGDAGIHGNGTANGSATKLNGYVPCGPTSGPMAFNHHRHHHYRHRSSLLSLHRASFGQLEKITETEEEEGKSPTLPTFPSHSPVSLQDAFNILQHRLSSLDDREDDHVVDENASGRDSRETDGSGQTMSFGHVGLSLSNGAIIGQSLSTEQTIVRRDTDGDAKDNDEEDKEKETDDWDNDQANDDPVEVTFSLREVSQTSSPDLENSLTDL